MDDWLDGNAIAGVLVEIFGRDMTTVVRGCPSCGARHEVGAHRLYRGAGLVLRCPSCDDVALRLALADDRRLVTFQGTWSVELPA